MADFSRPTNAADEGQRNAVVLKVGMVGDARVGKTTLMVKYVENKLDEDYIQTLGVNFLEKTVTLRNNDITFSIWDLGGHVLLRRPLLSSRCSRWHRVPRPRRVDGATCHAIDAMPHAAPPKSGTRSITGRTGIPG